MFSLYTVKTWKQVYRMSTGLQRMSVCTEMPCCCCFSRTYTAVLLHMRLWTWIMPLQEGQECSTSLQSLTQNGMKQQGQHLLWTRIASKRLSYAHQLIHSTDWILIIIWGVKRGEWIRNTQCLTNSSVSLSCSNLSMLQYK